MKPRLESENAQRDIESSLRKARVFSPALMLALIPNLLLSQGSGLSQEVGDRGTNVPEIALAIDDAVQAELNRAGIQAAPPADDATFARRVMLDLTGRIPTLQESQSFCESNDANKRQMLIDRLLDSPRYATHQVDFFDAVLMHGTGGNLREYLAASFQQQKSWDRMFRELVYGESHDTEQKGAIQFVKRRANDLDKLTNDASVLFFGVNVSCAQCHDHPLVPEWSQQHFFGMKSFFSRTFVHGEFIGERAYGGVTYKTSKGEERSAHLMFLTGTSVPEPESLELNDAQKKAEKTQLEELKKNKHPPPPPEFSRRAQLVEIALQPTENQYFSRAMVNRMWARFMGRGLVDPIDQMHPENRSCHPELLTRLANDFARNGYDLRRLIRGLVSSQTYARSSHWSGTERPDPSLFAVANVRPLSPRQYAMLLQMAASSPEVWLSKSEPATSASKGDSPAGSTSITPPVSPIFVPSELQIDAVARSSQTLVEHFELPQDDFQVSIAEALFLSNNPKIERDLLSSKNDSLIGKLLSIDDHQELIATAVRNVLSRPPQPQEVQLFSALLTDRANSREAACRHIVWALMTSSECRFNH